MILVVFNKANYEYDVHSLIKAFFPKEDVCMVEKASPEESEQASSVFYINFFVATQFGGSTKPPIFFCFLLFSFNKTLGLSDRLEATHPLKQVLREGIQFTKMEIMKKQKTRKILN